MVCSTPALLLPRHRTAKTPQRAKEDVFTGFEYQKEAQIGKTDLNMN